MTSIKFLGTSDSRGVPRMLCDCAVCTGQAPRNIRMRPSICVRTDEQQILVDTAPDFRQQFLQFSNGKIPQDALITHLHNDHIAGIGDFADLCFWSQIKARVFSPEEMIMGLQQRFAWVARSVDMIAASEVRLSGWKITFHKVQHGANGYSYAIRFVGQDGVWAYMPDAFGVTEEQFQPLYDLDLLILGAAFWREDAEPHRRSIYDVQEAVSIKQKLRAKYLILTHLSHGIDIPRYASELPANVEFAYDGMEVNL